MPLWPRPERLLPPRLLEALSAAVRGDAPRALELTDSADAADVLAGPVVRLVRGLAAHESHDLERSRAPLRAAARDRDPALALLATQALAEQQVASRRFASARPLVRRLRRRPHAADVQIALDALYLWIELLRRGSLNAGSVQEIVGRVERRHAAPVHATVHLLRAERALLGGDLAAAVAAQREARPYVQAADHAILHRRHDAVVRLLRAPFVEVEDWEEPLRPLSREDLALLEARPWRLWIDTLHRHVRHRPQRDAVARAIDFARAPQLWQALLALLHTPRRRLSWAQLRDLAQLDDDTAARSVAERLARKLRDADVVLQVQSGGLALVSERFVFVFPLADLPAVQQRLLALLAAQPGARAAELAADGDARRTTVRHLSLLRQAGYVRLVGGGREARYFLV